MEWIYKSVPVRCVFMKKLLGLLMTVFVLFGAGCVTDSNVSFDVQVEEGGKFPMSLLQDKSVKTLDISGKHYTGSLPSQIAELKYLRVLKAGDNDFTGVPAEVGQLKYLEVLDFSNNQLTGLPNELGNLSNLKILDLSGNNVSTSDLETIKKNLPSTVEIRL